MRLFNNYVFLYMFAIVILKHDISIYLYIQDTKIENITLYLVCLQNANLYFYLHFISIDMVGMDKTVVIRIAVLRT